MAGSWEIRSQSQVLVAILHTDVTSIAWAFGLRNLIVPGHVVGLSGMPFDHARNQSVKLCLEKGYEWLFSLDSDVIPPHDAILRLMSHKLPIVSGMYYRRSPPHAIPVMLRNGMWVTDFPRYNLFEVDLVGAGCMLVHRSVFERLPPQRPGKPWFDWRVDMQGLLPQGECLSEDFTFDLWARKHGYKIMVDPAVQCRHVGLAQATYGQFLPCEANPST